MPLRLHLGRIEAIWGSQIRPSVKTFFYQPDITSVLLPFQSFLDSRSYRIIKNSSKYFDSQIPWNQTYLFDCSNRAHNDMQHHRDRLKIMLETTNNEKQQLERVRQNMFDQIESMTMENQKLQAANSDLQRQRDQLEDEKEDVFKDKERQYKENERWLVILLRSTASNSLLHSTFKIVHFLFFRINQENNQTISHVTHRHMCSFLVSFRHRFFKFLSSFSNLRIIKKSTLEVLL